MAFVSWDTFIQTGDIVRSVQVLEIAHGFFEVGTVFTVTEVSERGFDLVDDKGFIVRGVRKRDIAPVSPVEYLARSE